MIARTMLMAALACTLLSQPAAAAQVAAGRQDSTDASVPIYRITVVGRTTVAINYRQSGKTKVDLVGTALLPDSHGEAEVSAKQGHAEIDARIRGLQRPTRYGSEYLTYVLWAITPEGRPRNLGEVQFTGEDVRKEVTTELQAFALILTAEPYFAVTQPSDVVVMENHARQDTRGRADTVQARYELLPRGSYLMNRPSEFTSEPRQPGVPLDLSEARNAIELSRLAGARDSAADTFSKATRLLAEAAIGHQKGRSSDEVIALARQATQTAEDARLIAVRRQDDALAAHQQALVADRERQALDQRQRADRESQNAVQAQSEAEHQRRAADRARDELQQARLDALKAQAAVAVAEQEKNALREQLRDQLNRYLDTRESARGLIMMVPDVLFETASARLTPVAREKLARVSGILAAQPDLHIVAEGHADSVGGDESNQRLSEQRAQSVAAYLTQQNIAADSVDVAAFGESRPIASNETVEGRRQNRRVELIVSGDSIGVPGNASPQ